MKKLKKIKLQNSVVLDEREMKTIYGGSGGYGGGGNCNWYTCTCSEPTSSVVIGDKHKLIQAPDIFSAAQSLSSSDCMSYNRVSCSFDKPC